MKQFARTIRLSEVLYPFGAGAIGDISGESFISLDSSWWPNESKVLECRRLEESLGAPLKTPPSIPDRAPRDYPGLTFKRFPEWRFCQDCRRVSKQLKRTAGVLKNDCINCSGPMVPMRFVAVCISGSHIQEIPWVWWTHRASENEEHQRCQEKSLLEFRSVDGAGGGLNGLMTICLACGSSRRLSELVGAGSMARDGIRCRGTQPWEPDTGTRGCDSALEVVQRGSASNHLAEIVSALDIPEVPSQTAQVSEAVRAHSAFSSLEGSPDIPGAETRAEIIAADCGTTADVVMNLARAGMAPIEQVNSSLRGGEWAAFMRGLDRNEDRVASDFVVREEPVMPEEVSSLSGLSTLVSRIGGVHRLREVRALTGFRRYSLEADLVRVDLGRRGGIPRWYPAVESFGEGIFLQISESAIFKWEQQPEVKRRAEEIEARRQNSEHGSRLHEATPRYLALHTLAHLLIQKLAAESGYSSASLRERVYAVAGGTEPQAGILIYTATGDSEGTLGGLVRQAKSKNLVKLLLRSLEEADLCSNDPVCEESTGQGSNGFNLAACHACALVAETSCENANAFLDRTMLLGGSSCIGLFETMLAEARLSLTTN
jgi:hypothetical protein